MSEIIPRIELKPRREAAVRRRHPWIFSGAIETPAAGIKEGDIVSVHAFGGEIMGYGHFCAGNICVKMLSFEKIFDTNVFLEKRIARAIEVRRKLGLMESSETTGFRLVNAEGDNLPGLIVDLYANTAVVQFHSVGMARLRAQLVEALCRKLSGRLLAIYDKSKDLGGAEGDTAANGYLWGEPQPSEFKENGLRFLADWEHGQKTGFFLDQRDNRKLLGSLARGKRILNCFSYTGGFSVYALAGAAKEVVSVDASSVAMQVLANNVALNFQHPAHRAIEADCLEFLRQLDQAYDIIILDPPAFVKHRSALRSGVKGYENINHLALSQLQPGGLLFTFSCSQLLSREDFCNLVQDSAKKAGKKTRVLHELRQAACHPVSSSHPEGHYLKGLVLEVL